MMHSLAETLLKAAKNHFVRLTEDMLSRLLCEKTNRKIPGAGHTQKLSEGPPHVYLLCSSLFLVQGDPLAF